MEKYGIITVVLILLSIVYLKVADRFNIIDKPNHRSSHTEPTIRGGGAIFLFALWVFFIISDFSYPYLVVGVSLIAIVSFIDDIVTLSSKVRFPFQVLAVVLCMFQLDLLEFPLWSNLIVLIIGLGFLNFYNFMDGINGITGLYSMVMLAGFYLINNSESIVDQDLLRILMISLIIFGYYNFRKKARCFAGDIGSISISGILLFIGLSLIYKLQAPVIILFAVVYGIDALVTLFYRKYLGEKITDPHRHHIYQKLVDIKKLPHMYVSLLYAFLQLSINCIVILTYKKSVEIQLFVFVGVVFLVVCLYAVVFRYLEKIKN